MSQRENPVSSMLAVNSTSLLTKNNTLDDLQAGQLGFFGYESGESFDETTSASNIPRKFYIAVKSPSGELIKESAANFIDRTSILSPIYRKNYVSPQSMTATVSGFKPLFDTSYGIKVNFKNSHIERLFGYININKTFVVKTRAMNGADEPDATLDPNHLTLDFVNEIENNSDDLLDVEIVADQEIADTINGISSTISQGGVVTEAEVNAVIAHNAANPGSAPLTTGLKLTPKPSPIGERLGGINIQYHKLLQTKIVVSLLQNLNNGSTNVTTTGITFEQGSGEDVMEKEYQCAPFSEGSSPYRASEMTGLSMNSVRYFASKDKNYTQFSINYRLNEVVGSLDYTNSFNTCIAIPSTGASGLITKVNTILGKVGEVVNL